MSLKSVNLLNPFKFVIFSMLFVDKESFLTTKTKLIKFKNGEITYSHAVSIDKEASIFSIGGISP